VKIYQNSLDEHLLWKYLQTGEFDKAKEVVDWYYSSSNPNGFDDPKGVKNADKLIINEPLHINSLTEIKRNRKEKMYLLIFILVFSSFFVFLSVWAGSFFPMFIPSPLLPIAIIVVYYYIRNPTIISLSTTHVEFSDSKKSPIQWNNILAVYYYRREFGAFRYPGLQDGEFVHIFRKNGVKPEIFNIKGLEIEPEKIVCLINLYRQNFSEKFELTEKK
jgi:hypothetical protein